MGAVRRVAGAAFIYFCALFTALGVSRLVRDLMDLIGLDVLLGQIVGALLVAFLLLPASGFAVRVFAVPPGLIYRLGVGAGAIVLMIGVAVVEVTFFRRFFAAELAGPPDRTLGYITLCLAAFAILLPLFRERHGSG